jgi:hypothetical protein
VLDFSHSDWTRFRGQDQSSPRDQRIRSTLRMIEIIFPIRWGKLATG